MPKKKSIDKKGEGLKERRITFLADEDLAFALEGASMYLDKSMGEILRESLVKYLDENYPKDVHKKIKTLLKIKR